MKDIGVSNYRVSHLDELLEYARVPPAVVQSECHVLYSNADVRSWCEKHGAHFQA